MNKPYVQSNYERIKDDNYQTIDRRCIRALIDTYPIMEGQTIIDCCANRGSGIVDGLHDLGFIATGINDAFDTTTWATWNIFNPPYKRGYVDKIIRHQIRGLEDGRFGGLALLVRNNFDFAKSRWDMFTHQYYAGQVHMMFRPWWMSEKKSSPIHNFVWHVWLRPWNEFPTVKYWKENK